jgi:hypothetical protein
MNVRRLSCGVALLAASLVQPCPALRAADLDIKRIALTDAHTVVYAKQNEERAYQGEYLADAWKTFQEEKIAERVFDLISSRAPEEELAKVKAAWGEIEAALEPIKLQALVDGEEFVMFNAMVGPFGQTVVAVRLTENDAQDYREGMGNLFTLIQKWSKDEVTAESSDASGAKVTTLKLPAEVPYHPCVASIEDLFLISTSDDLLKKSLAQLQDPSAKSKFDDERFKAALSHLPEPEDAVTFFDANQLFGSMRNLGEFIRQQKPDSEDTERIAKVLNHAIDEFDILEYETVVEYTEKGQNRSASYGQVSDKLEDSILGRALSQGEAFKNWQSWVPADATAYSMNTGINLHELYVGVMGFVREEFPEAKEALDKWDEVQQKVGVNLDQDLLQAFSGENVSITLGDGATVTALKCSNEQKVRELIDRAIEGLKQIPAIQQQQIDLVDSDDAALEGFQEFKFAALAMTGARPMIGFRDGWMILASSPGAAKSLLAVRAGEASSIEGAESLKRFGMKTDGEVYSVSHSDIGAGIRAVADGITQFSMMAPMFLAAATADASEEDKKTLNGALGLLPSIAKVIRKFDFYEQNLSITREGPEEGTYLRESVTLIRQPSGS